MKHWIQDKNLGLPTTLLSAYTILVITAHALINIVLGALAIYLGSDLRLFYWLYDHLRGYFEIMV